VPVTLPHEPPYTLSKDRDDRGRAVDALLALVERLRTQPPHEWPDALLLMGDQIYADQVSPETERLIEERRGSGDASADVPPQGDVADFEEYTRLYREAWSDPATRWLLSTVSSAMIFDDHDVHDDWNTSWAWVREIRTVPWWHERILGASMSYGIYQHLGTLSPAELAENALLTDVRAAHDAEQIPRTFATGRGGDRGNPLELPSGLRTHPAARAGFPCRPRAGRGPPRDALGAGVGVGRGLCHRRLRPPADRDDAAIAAVPGSAPPGSVERGGLRRGLLAGRRRGWGRRSATRSTSSSGRRSTGRSFA
jgi:PhoD-like phosphatase